MHQQHLGGKIAIPVSKVLLPFINYTHSINFPQQTISQNMEYTHDLTFSDSLGAGTKNRLHDCGHLAEDIAV